MTHPGRRLVRGFTLVELLIAIGIFSLVVAAIYACWSAVLRSSKVGLDAAARAQRSRMALQSLEEALTYTKMHAANPDRYAFEFENGSDAWISFVAQLPRSFPRGGKFGQMLLRRVEFSLREGDDRNRELVLRQAPLLMEFDEDERNYPLVLGKQIDSMEIQAWDPEAADWVDTWTTTNEIPELVRVSLVTLRGTGYNTRKVESAMVVRPAARAVAAMSQSRAAPRGPGGPGVQRGAPGGGAPRAAPGGPVPRPAPGGNR